MEFLVNLFILLACICIVCFVSNIIWREWTGGKPKRQHLTRERKFGQAVVLSDNETPTPRESQQRNFALMGIPQVDAGQIIHNVPAYNPGEGKETYWESDQQVITSTTVTGYTNRGADETDMYELSRGYFIVSCVGKAFIMNDCSLKAAEAQYLEDQRIALFDTSGKDNIIENFRGHRWLIRTSLGKNKSQKPDERDWSYIEVKSQHPDLGKDGLRSVLPPQILAESGPHNYTDLRASQIDEAGNKTGIVLFGFYSEGKWNAMMGRELSPEEIDSMQAV